MARPTPFVSIALVAAPVLLLGPWLGQAGFVSDDLAQRARAGSIAWWEPLVGHHASPLLTLLYQASGAGALPLALWQGAALACHAASAWLLWRLLRVGLGVDATGAAAGALLFAATPVAIEPVLWPAASCFAPLGSLLLASLVVALEGRDRDDRGARALALAALQVLAFFVWDWALVVAPAVAGAVLLADSGAGDPVRRRRLALRVAPALAVWGLALGVRAALGTELGYGLFPIGLPRALVRLAVMPGMVLAPSLPPIAVGAAALPALALLAWAAWRRPAVRPLVWVVGLVQVPWFFQGAPESRYAYLAAPFLGAGLAVAWLGLAPGRLRAAALAAVGLLGLAQAGQQQLRAREWVRATRDAAALGDRLAGEAARLEPGQPLLVVNLPDHDERARGLWPPPLWRNGLPARLAPVPVLEADTPAFAARHEPHDPRPVPRDRVRERHPGIQGVEVRPGRPGVGPAFEVAPFDPAAPDP